MPPTPRNSETAERVQNIRKEPEGSRKT